VRYELEMQGMRSHFLENFWGKIWADLGKIKILHPQKHSISYVYAKVSKACYFADA